MQRNPRALKERKVLNREYRRRWSYIDSVFLLDSPSFVSLSKNKSHRGKSLKAESVTLGGFMFRDNETKLRESKETHCTYMQQSF